MLNAKQKAARKEKAIERVKKSIADWWSAQGAERGECPFFVVVRVEKQSPSTYKLMTHKKRSAAFTRWYRQVMNDCPIGMIPLLAFGATERELLVAMQKTRYLQSSMYLSTDAANIHLPSASGGIVCFLLEDFLESTVREVQK